MEHLSQTSGWAALLMYSVTAVLLVSNARRPAQGVEKRGTYRIPAAIAIVFHAVSIYTGVFQESELSIGFFNALSLTSLLMAVLLFVVSIKQSLEILGVVLFPLAGICAVVGALTPSQAGSTPMDLQWHILASVMAYGMLALAASQAVALSIQTHHLRRLQPQGILSALPPINLMEKLLFQMVGAGFILLSLSLLTGVLFLEDVFAQHLVHKTVLTILSWVIFGVLLAGRIISGWRGKTALVYTLSGLGVLIVGYFGSKLVLEFILA